MDARPISPPSVQNPRAAQAAPAPAAGNAWTRLRARPWWPWATRLVTLAFLSLVVWLMVTQARTVAWAEVMRSIAEMPKTVLLAAAVLSFLTYGMYATFDLIGRYYARHRLSTRAVLGIGFISYAFNLNLGTLVGGIAFRYRLYTRMGVHAGQTAHITLLSMLTNWIGYCLLAGVLYWRWPPDLPDKWKIDTRGLQAIGIGLACVALAYVATCALRHGRPLTVRGREIPLPNARIGMLQLVLSGLHWMMMGGILYVLMRSRVAYPAVLATLLVAAIAGVIAHVPAGLGVLETVFVTLLADQLPRNDILAALLTYRALYYLLPLLVAAIAYFALEFHLRRRAEPDGSADGTAVPVPSAPARQAPAAEPYHSRPG